MQYIAKLYCQRPAGVYVRMDSEVLNQKKKKKEYNHFLRQNFRYGFRKKKTLDFFLKKQKNRQSYLRK